MATRTATTGVDNLTGTGGADNFVFGAGTANAGDVFNAGGGTDVIQIVAAATVDFTSVGSNLTSFNGLVFLGAGTSTFSSTQLVGGAGNLPTNLAVTGAAGVNAIVANMPGTGTFSLASWTFTTWTAGTDTITINGSAAADTITGSSQADRISAGLGNDAMTGGTGADIFVLAANAAVAQADTVSDFSLAQGDRIDLSSAGPASWDVLNNLFLTTGAGGSAELQGLRNDLAQNLTLTGVSVVSIQAANGPVSAPNFIFDTSGASRNVTGTAGADKIFGGLGADTLVGGDGADILAGDAGGDSLDGGLGDDRIFAGSGNDSLIGGIGNDRLYGEAGDDSMTGGTGNDIYYVDSIADVVVEASGGGTDTVQTLSDWTLGAGQELEYVHINTTTGRSLTGNELGNWLQGNAGADTLIGANGNDNLDGGAGADSLDGGLGDDTFNVDDAGDVVAEASGQGSDTVVASANWTANAGAYIETIRAATAGLNVVGNELANTMQGTSGGDTLGGGAGNDRLYGYAGSDSLVGGAGNDMFYVTDTGDVVNEATGGGADSVQVSATWTLTAGQEVEYVHINTATGLSLTGNELGNWLDGNSGNDTISGGDGNDDIYGGGGADRIIGGAGNDRQTGGAGNDVMVFEDGWGKDTVTGFENDLDTLDLTAVTGLTDISQLTISTLGDGSLMIGFVGHTDSIRVIGNVDATTVLDDIVF